MKEKVKKKGFIISIIGRDFRKTAEQEANRGEVSQPVAGKEDTGKKQILKKDKTHYRIEYTKDGPKIWTLH